MIDIKQNEKLSILNHSCAHLLAHAVKHLYPEAKFWVGPVISEGFYYDIDLGDKVISEDDLAKITKEMKKIVKSDKLIKKIELTKDEALTMFKEDPYKIDLINEMPEGEHITAYKQDDFTDLCKGPHVKSTKELKHFKLLKVSGAYYKGDANNKVLQRVYGVCYPTSEELEEHLKLLEEAKERDHRKLGKELELFTTDKLVGAGLPMWLPNGAVVRCELENYIRNKEIKEGYHHVYTPSLGSTELYKISGHWDHYKDDMFPIMKMDNEELVLRPMNCPHHMLIYRHNIHSYRDLPIRIGELAPDFRYEASGAVCGLERVRQMCQNDAHLFVRPDQIKDEVAKVVNLILSVYKDFNITNYSFRLSLRDKEDKEKYFDDDKMWDKAESELRKVLDELNLDYYEAKGEAAFYGPKLDVQIKSAIGHDVTLSTCQLDFLLPERFDLTYVDQNGEKVRPVVIHRAILGTFDRFMAYLIEETKGAFIYNLLKDNNIRVKLDDREEKLGYKMRESVTHKIPFALILGDKEKAENLVSYRKYGTTDTVTVTKEEFLTLIKDTIINKK